MTEPDLAAANTTLSWDVGTAYEFFVSLYVLHEPEYYDLRPSWAAKIRSRIPTTERTFLEEALAFIDFPISWLYRLPQPKNAITVLYALQQIPPAKRGREMFDLDAGIDRNPTACWRSPNDGVGTRATWLRFCLSFRAPGISRWKNKT